MSIAINPGEDPTASSGTSPDPSSDTDGSRSSSSSSGSSGSRDGKEAIVPHDPY
jgi:hypothetical protein